MLTSSRTVARSSPVADLAARFNVQPRTSDAGELRVTPGWFGSVSLHVNTSGHGTRYGSQATQDKRRDHRAAACNQLEAAFRKSLVARRPTLQPSEYESIVSTQLASARESGVTVGLLRRLMISEMQNFSDRSLGRRSDRKHAVVVSSSGDSRTPQPQTPAAEAAVAFHVRTAASAAGSSSVHVHLATPPKAPAVHKPTQQELFNAYTQRFASQFGQYKGTPGEHIEREHEQRRIELAKLIEMADGSRWIRMPQDGLPLGHRFQSAVFQVANGSSADEAYTRVFSSGK